MKPISRLLPAFWLAICIIGAGSCGRAQTVPTASSEEFITGIKFGQSDTSRLSELQHMSWMKQYGFNSLEIEAWYMENGLARQNIIAYVRAGLDFGAY